MPVALSGSLLIEGVDGQFLHMKRVVSADAIIPDKCGSWYNLNRDIIQCSIPNAWIFRL